VAGTPHQPSPVTTSQRGRDVPEIRLPEQHAAPALRLAEMAGGSIHRRGFLAVGGGALAATLAPVAAHAVVSKSRGLPPGSVVARLDKDTYRRGEAMTLVVRSGIRTPAVSVTDSTGTVWKRVSREPFRRVYRSTAGDQPTGRVRVVVTRRSDGASDSVRVDYAVTQPAPGPGSGPGRWPGHVPGKIVLGLSSTDIAASVAAVGPVGLRRSFYNWGDAAEHRSIVADHASGRLPWVSFKPPGGGPAGWAGVAAGNHDADIKAMARRYADYSRPVISTFHHEPTNDGGDPADYAAAWVRIHDLMRDETGLANVTFAPILGDWEFNPRHREGRPDAYLTPAVLARIPFLGIDLYQNAGNEGFAQRLVRVLDWLDYRGVKDPMVGIGETGCCLEEDPEPHEWLRANWEWAVAHTDQIGVMSYFDSSRNSKDRHVWSLKETPAKTDTYKSLLASPTSTGLH
jgi:hypothetical protein